MRSLPLVLLAVAALLAPTAALAGGSATSTARYFVITGMVLGGQKAEATGKLAIDGSQLSASVGCNLIGGKVGVDGDMITISEPLAMTEMACPGTNGDLEAMLIKVLQHGPFRISATEWFGNGAQILVEELDSGVPGPGASAPDEPVTSSPGAVIVDPATSCPPYASGDPGVINGTVEPDGGPTLGGGSGSSDGSGATDGSTGTGGAPAAGSDGSTGVGTEPSAATSGEEPPAPPVATDPAPSFEPGVKEPEPSTVTVEPAPSAIAVPDPGTVTGPGASVDIDPGFGGNPVPSDPCAERMYAVDQGGNAGGAGIYPPKAGDAAAEHAASASNPTAPLVALGLVLLTVALVAVATLRRRQAGSPMAEPPSVEPGPPTPR
ncbi:MAG TPA: META domain-containing protein [Candidatus Limnocylindrales bacterium]